MSGDPRDPPAHELLLAGLLADVIEARHREASSLQERGGRPEKIRAARAETLTALLAFASAIEARSWPVPRNIRLEISLRRSLSGQRKRAE